MSGSLYTYSDEHPKTAGRSPCQNFRFLKKLIYAVNAFSPGYPYKLFKPLKTLFQLRIWPKNACNIHNFFNKLNYICRFWWIIIVSLSIPVIGCFSFPALYVHLYICIYKDILVINIFKLLFESIRTSNSSTIFLFFTKI